MGGRAARRRRLSGRGRRDIRRQRADQGALRPRRRPAGSLDARRRLRARAGGARRGARECRPRAGPRAVTSSGRSPPSTDAADRAARTWPSSSCSRPTGASCGARASSTATIALEPAGEGGFGFDPVFVPAARRAPSPSSATNGKRSTRIAPWPRRRSRGALRAASDVVPPVARRRLPPVDLGAEHDHVRHHVEPHEQHRRARERLQHRVVLRDVDVHRQELERRLQDHRRGHRPRSTSHSVRSTFVST